MWTVRITQAEFKLLLEGKTVEKVLEQGLVTIEQDPTDALLTIRFLTLAESGFGLRVP